MGTQQRARTEATYYTVPAIEVGDNIALYTGNVYAVANVSYDPNYPGDYNSRITANTVYRISLNETIRANVGGRIITNITNDPQGTMGNVHQGNNSVTFDYNATTYPSNWNLANNQIYDLILDKMAHPDSLVPMSQAKLMDLNKQTVMAARKLMK